jgi:hypothetical protein
MPNNPENAKKKSKNAENAENCRKFRKMWKSSELIAVAALFITSAFYPAKSHKKMQANSINSHLIPKNKLKKFRKYKKFLAK